MSTCQFGMPSRQRARLPGWVLMLLVGGATWPPSANCAAPPAQEQSVRGPKAAAEPDWAIPYGGEFWRHSPTAGHRATTDAADAAAGIELGHVIERVSHAFRRVDQGPDSRRQVRTPSYAAELGPQGLRFSPQLPRRAAKRGGLTDATATLRLARMLRGDQVVCAGREGSLAWRITGNVGQTLLEEPPGLIEHHEALADGVHVSWVLRHVPSGQGPIWLEFEVSGLRFQGSTASGHHFGDAQGQARVRVGQARFVDANGVSVDLLTHTREGRLRIVVPEAALDAAAFPAVIDPVIGAEFGMDNPVPGLAIGDQSSATLASDGTNYLAVWQDTRGGAEEDVFGTRVNGGGVILDPEGIAICRAAGVQSSPAVAWGGNAFCVVWQDERTPDNETDIYGARVTSSGLVLEPDGFPICTLPGVQQEPALAGSSNGFLVVWQHARGGLTDNIFGTGIAPDGTVFNPNGTPILPSALAQAHPAVATGANGYLVVWDANAGASIQATRVAADRTVLDSNALLVTSAPGQHEFPAVAFAGDDYLVAWLDHLTASSTSFNIYGARITPNGSVRDFNGFPICTNAGEQSGPAVAGTGAEFLVVWHDLRNGTDYDIYGTKVSAGGVVQQTNGFPILAAPGTQFAPAVGSDGVGFLVAWTDSRAGSADIRATRISGADMVADPTGLLVSRTANRQLKPAVAASLDRYLVVWEDYRNLTNLSSLTADVYGCRISASGTVLDVDGLPIAAAPNRRRNPAVASDGTNFLVVWEQQGISDLYGARVSSSGGLLDPGGFPISLAANNQLSPALAYAGGVYLAVWDDSRSFSTYDIYGCRITPAGVVLDSGGIPISTATGNQVQADVAPLGTNFLVAWQDARAGGNRIYGARVTPGGTILDLGNVAINSSSIDPQGPRLAGDGTNCLVVWQAFDVGNASNDILGARVSPTASVIGPSGFLIGQSSGRQFRPDVVWAGGNYLVAWQDDRAAFDTWDIYGTRVSRAGLVLDTNGLPLATAAGSQTLTALAAIGSSCLVIYEGPGSRDVERVQGTLVAVDAEPCVPAPAGAVAWWTADGNAGDSVGGNHGVVGVGGTFVAGEVGQGFSAGTGYFRVTNSPSLRPDQVTVVAWVMGTNVGAYQYILSKSYLGVGSSYGLYAGGGSPGGLYFYLWGLGFSPFAPPGIWDGRFHHVAGTYDGLTIRLYLDGTEVGTGTSASGPINYGTQYHDGDLFVGSVDPTQPMYNWSGIVDEVAVFNRALAASEISNLYLAGSLGMCGPPRLVGSPINRTIAAGEETILDVSVRGEGLSYQWWRDGVPVPGATNSSLTLRNADALAAGEYWVVISNVLGFTASSSATVSVLVPPTITSQPQSQTVHAPDSASFTVEASGTFPLGFTWLHNGVPVATFVQTQATSTLSLPHVSPSDEGLYKVIVTNIARPNPGVASEPATLTVLSAPSILQQPTNLTVAPNARATFCVSVIGSAPLRFQWRHNGVNVPGATNACLTISNVLVADGGTYSAVIENPVITLTSESAQLIVDVPFRPANDNFADRIVLEGSNGVVQADNLLATAESGEPHPTGNPGGHSVWYAWTPPANGVVTFSTAGSTFDTVMGLYLGATLGSLTVQGEDDDSGSFFSSRVQIQSEVAAGRTYAIQIDGAFGATGQLVMSWQFEGTPEILPRISTPPVSLSVLRGSNASFSVTASGVGLRYQWYLNGRLLSGATNTSIMVTNVQPGSLGVYLVKVSTASGLHEATAAAVLEIGPVPSVQSQDKFQSLFQPNPGPGGIAPAAANGFLSVSVGVPLALFINNTNSTTQQFEPVECRIDGASRWLQIRVAESAICILDTIGSQIDTVLGIYTGSDLLSLVQVGCDDNSAPDGIRSQLRFSATPGIDYRVRVDGVNGAQGVIALNARLGQPPLPCTNLFNTNLVGTNLVIAAGGGVTLPAPCTNWAVNGIRYQWKLNGTNLPGATNHALELRVNAPAGHYAVETFNEYGGFTAPLGAVPIPYLTQLEVLANGRVRVVVQRPANQAVVLETTADLRTWVPWQTIPRTTPGPVVEMPAAPDVRWFRARPVP